MTDYSDSIIEFANVIITLDAIASYGVSVTESVSETDTSIASSISSGSITESISAVDTSNRFVTSYISESALITDTLNAVPVYNPKFADFISPLDRLDIVSYTLNSDVAEAVSATDTLDAFISNTITESISVTDTLDAVIVSNIVETINLIDTMDATGINLTTPSTPSINPIPNPVQVREYLKDKRHILQYTYRKTPLA